MCDPLRSVSRRNLVGNCTLTALAILQNVDRVIAQDSRRSGASGSDPELIRADHPGRQYSYLPGISPYSGGVVAREGYEIVHATFLRAPSLLAGFKAIDDHLSEVKLPKGALCAVELRSPRSLSSEEFRTFNRGYIQVLKDWGILLERGLNPVARTNVVPVLFPPHEPSVHGFSYVVQSAASQKTFIVAGGGELPDGSIDAADIVRRGDTSPGGIAAKARYVMARMEARLRALGVDWPQVTTINVYTARDLGPALLDEMLKQAVHNSFTWNYARPPIKDLEFEMDLRGIRREILLG